MMFAGILAFFARAILRKYRPTVIMVTGSVGKTSTKDAIAAALGPSSDVRASEKSYNSEFGVPLTIIGAKNPWSDPVAWFQVFDEATELLAWRKHYPKTLVLEVGADRPGDLARILKIATPDAVVVTRLPEVPVHVEAYASPAAVREEEFAPAYALPSGAPLILSSRDTHAIAMAKNTQASVTLFGFSKEADIHIEEPTIVMENGKPAGMQTTATVEGKTYTLTTPGVLGRPQVLAPAAALALTHALGIPVERALKGLARYTPPPGRARILKGKNGSILIDDSYNASPAAVEEALQCLSHLSGRKIAVLGDMLELGRYSAQEHERIGALAGRYAAALVAVGIRSRAMKAPAIAAGMKEENVFIFDNAAEAGEHLVVGLHEGDVILVKGSQSVRMERLVEHLLADPKDVKYLVRQDAEWRKR